MNGPERFLEEFRRVERADPWWSLAHLAAAIAWVALLGVTHAGEGISFGILVAVAAIRLPSTRCLYARLLRSPTAACFLAFVAWQAASVAWSSNPAVRWHTGAVRFAAVPFALWPLAHRARELAIAFCLSAVAHSAGILAVNVRPDRVARHVGASAGKELGMTAACLLPALLVMLLAGRPRSRTALAGRGLGALLVTGALVILSQRTSFVAAGAGLAAAATKLVVVPGARRRILWPFAVAALLLVPAGLATPRVREMAVDAWKAAAGSEVQTDDLNRISSGRYSLALVALEMFHERPMLGWGSRSFETENAARMSADPKRYDVPRNMVDSNAALTTSHNAFLDEASMRGIAGIVLLALLVQCMLFAAWGDTPEPATLAAVVAWVAFGFADATTSRGTYLALLGLLVARCAMLECMRGSPRRARSRPR